MAWQGRFDRPFLGGEWVAPSTDKRIEVVSPTTEQVFATVPEASEADVDRAVGAAREPSTTAHGRAPRSTSGSRCCAG
jgi:aldehyde dehydrogenase (NAD+)